MADAHFEEVIRLAFEAAGTEGIQAAARAIASLGDISEETRAQAVALLDSVASTEKSERAIDAYRAVGDKVLQYQRQVATATQGVKELAAAVAASEAPTRAQERELDRARSTLKDLVSAQQAEVAKLRETRATLDASGISLRSYSAAKRDLAAAAQQAGDKLQAMAGQLRAERDAEELAEAAAKRHQEQLAATAAQAQEYATTLKQVFKEAGSAIKESAADLDNSARGTETASRLERTRAALENFVSASEDELRRLREINVELQRSGASTAELITGQALLARRSREVAAQTEALTRELGRARAAEAAFQQQLVAERSRAQAEERQYQDALRRTKDQIDRNSQASRDGSREATAGMERTQEAASRLRGILATLVTFFSFDALIRGVKSLLATGDEFARYEKQLASLYGTQAKGEQAFEWVKAFTKTTPLQLQDVMKSFIMLKNFGIDPTRGALAAVVDQNARLGGESQRLERITLALGQAWAKTKLQGEEIMQLVEAGVPVYKILGEVTGKTAGELQQLGAAGKLGQDVLRKFIAQMGKDSLGAAADQVENLGGQWTILMDNIQQAESQAAKSGIMTYLRDQLKALNKEISSAVADGRLAQYAQKVSDALVSVAKAIKGATIYAIEHAEAIGTVIKAYAAFKLGSILGELALGASRFVQITRAALDSQAAVGGVASKASILTKALRALPPNIQIALAVVGFDLLKEAGEYLGQLAGRHSAAQKSLDALIKRQRDARELEARGYQETAAQYAAYKDLQIKSAEEVANLTDQQRVRYAEQVKGFGAYNEAMLKAQSRLVSVGLATGDTLDHIETALKDAQRAAEDLASGTNLAVDALSRGLPVAAVAAQDKLKGIRTDAEATKTRLAEIFQGFQTATITQLGDLALGIARAGTESEKTSETLRDGLSAQLQQLSAQDLLKFQMSAVAAFQAFRTGAAEAGNVLQPILEVGLQRLGVAADQWGLSSTEAGRANVAAFQLVAENALATSTAVEGAFNRALANTSTIDDAKSIGDAMRQAGEAGRLGFGATERAIAAVDNRVRQLQTAVDPLHESFAQLGITSKRALDDAAAAARSALAAIVAAQRAGRASIEDVRAAWAAYSRAQTDAAANSDTWKRQTVEAALQAQAAVLGVNVGLTDMGDVGLEAGDKVARGARRGAGALDSMASSARNAADAHRDAGAATEDAAEGQEHYASAADASAAASRRHAQETEALSHSLAGLSEGLQADLAALNQFAINPTKWRDMWNGVMDVATGQLNQWREQMKTLDAQNAKFDEMGTRVAALRNQYRYLNEEQVRALAQSQKTLEDNQRQAEEKAAQKRADDERAEAKRLQDDADATKAMNERWAKQDNGTTAPAPTPAVGADDRLSIDLKVSGDTRSGKALNLSTADRQALADLLLPQLVRQLTVRRTVANR